jgi:hypothetical protein
MAKVIFGNHAPLLLRPGFLIALAAAAAALGAPLVAKSAEIGAVKNVVLVHGANTDGSGWRGVYDILKKDGPVRSPRSSKGRPAPLERIR